MFGECLCLIPYFLMKFFSAKDHSKEKQEKNVNPLLMLPVSMCRGKWFDTKQILILSKYFEGCPLGYSQCICSLHWFGLHEGWRLLFNAESIECCFQCFTFHPCSEAETKMVQLDWNIHHHCWHLSQVCPIYPRFPHRRGRRRWLHGCARVVQISNDGELNRNRNWCSIVTSMW